MSIQKGEPIREAFVVPAFPDPQALQLRVTLVRAPDPRASGPSSRFQSADDFVDAHLDVGVRANYRLFFLGVQWLSWVLSFGLCGLAWHAWRLG